VSGPIAGASVVCGAKSRVAAKSGATGGGAELVDNSPPDNQKAVCWVVAGATNDPLGGVRSYAANCDALMREAVRLAWGLHLADARPLAPLQLWRWLPSTPQHPQLLLSTLR
jgi:hypothetical protein